MDRWVILAAERAARPHTVTQTAPASAGDESKVDCPFCPGQEHRTPPEVARSGPGSENTPGWRVRVVPNLFPIVGSPAPAPGPATDPLRWGGPAGGAHEVAVLSPAHARSLAHLEEAQVEDVLRLLHARTVAHAEAGHVYTQVMINHGRLGGASIAHPHAQLIAVDVPPPVLAREASNLVRDGTCLICSELERQTTDPSLVVLDGESPSWCPWWASDPYEMLIAPRCHRRRFQDAGNELPAVASALREGIRRLYGVAGDPPYNVVFHSLPENCDANIDFHWHIHIRPRLHIGAGFEMGTGLEVNTLDPAEAARRLRSTLLPARF